MIFCYSLDNIRLPFLPTSSDFFTMHVSTECSLVSKLFLYDSLSVSVCTVDIASYHFILFTSNGLANKVQCEINLRYESLAGDELVLLQDKLLLPTTKTDLNDMTSAKGGVVFTLEL